MIAFLQAAQSEAADRFGDLEKRYHFGDSSSGGTATSQAPQQTPFEALVNSTAGLAAAAGLAARTSNNVVNNNNTNNSNELLRQINALLDNTLDINGGTNKSQGGARDSSGMPLPPPGLSGPPSNGGTGGMSGMNGLSMIMNGGRNPHGTDNHVETGRLKINYI